MFGGSEQSVKYSNNQSVHWRFQKFRLYGLALQAILQQATGVLESNLLITDWSLVRPQLGPPVSLQARNNARIRFKLTAPVSNALRSLGHILHVLSKVWI
jgi:hypothetical protein